MKKKNVLFNIIASNKVGLGHAYRSLTIANLIKKNYNIYFLVKKNHYETASKLFKKKYKIYVYNSSKELKKILKKNFAIVINDRLDNSLSYMKILKKFNCKIVNIEDNGTGLHLSDIKINELGDSNKNNNNNIYYGYKYFLLRNEFLIQNKYKMRNRIKNILITFGGTDPSNYTLKTLIIINNLIDLNVKITIVVGPGYARKKSLKNYLKKINSNNVNFYDSTGLMAKLMSNADLAICSNGRTLIELAFMRVPSITISQNHRERTHKFWKLSNGSIHFNNLNNNKNLSKFKNIFEKCIKEYSFRKKLFDNLKKIKINRNPKLIKKIFDYVK